MKSIVKLRLCLICALLTTATSVVVLTGCKEKPRTIGERVDDALNTRPNEKLRDAAENVGDAAKDAGSSVKEAARDATN